MTPRKTIAAFALALAFGVAIVLPACSNQAEGDRCDTRSEDDCQDGLVCTAANLLNGAGNADRCCPPLADRARATTSVCSLPATPGSDAAIPVEAGGGDDAAVDAPDDAPIDAPDDTTSIADANDDGG